MATRDAKMSPTMRVAASNVASHRVPVFKVSGEAVNFDEALLAPEPRHEHEEPRRKPAHGKEPGHDEAGPRPVTLKERIRAEGPTVAYGV